MGGIVRVVMSKHGRCCPTCGAVLELAWWETNPWENLPGRFGAEVSCPSCTPLVRTVTDAG